MSWGQKMHKWDPDPEVQARRSCRYEDLVVPIFWLTYTAECMELKDGVWAEFSPEDEDGPIGFEEDGDERYRYFAWLMSVEEGQWIHNVFPVLLHFWERCAVNKGAKPACWIALSASSLFEKVGKAERVNAQILDRE
ncbi:hypothetical protein BU17DRAFT_104316 [Hysterangium stoloniferum]|nr:hypothetical protein BU17DRAFT_104316 [Hysterangium stoloniferum]